MGFAGIPCIWFVTLAIGRLWHAFARLASRTWFATINDILYNHRQPYMHKNTIRAGVAAFSASGELHGISAKGRHFMAGVRIIHVCLVQSRIHSISRYAA
jgi:hypothetical protein